MRERREMTCCIIVEGVSAVESQPLKVVRRRPAERQTAFKLGRRDEGSQSFCSAERREASAQECKMCGSILPIMG